MRAPIYDAVFDTKVIRLNSGVGTFYKYGVLAPKAISQIANNFISTNTLETLLVLAFV